MKVFVAAYHIVRTLVTLDDMANFSQSGTVKLHNGSSQTVRPADFLNRGRGDGEAELADREHHDLLPRAGIARRRAGICGRRHREPTGCIKRAADSTYFSIAGYISSMPRTKSTAPNRIASAGIPKITEVASSCARTRPRAALMACAPRAPSPPMPVNTTPTTFAPEYAAALSNATSAQGR